MISIQTKATHTHFNNHSMDRDRINALAVEIRLNSRILALRQQLPLPRWTSIMMTLLAVTQMVRIASLLKWKVVMTARVKMASLKRVPSLITTQATKCKTIIPRNSCTINRCSTLIIPLTSTILKTRLLKDTMPCPHPNQSITCKDLLPASTNTPIKVTCLLLGWASTSNTSQMCLTLKTATTNNSAILTKMDSMSLKDKAKLIANLTKRLLSSKIRRWSRLLGLPTHSSNKWLAKFSNKSLLEGNQMQIKELTVKNHLSMLSPLVLTRAVSLIRMTSRCSQMLPRSSLAKTVELRQRIVLRMRVRDRQELSRTAFLKLRQPLMCKLAPMHPLKTQLLRLIRLRSKKNEMMVEETALFSLSLFTAYFARNFA